MADRDKGEALPPALSTGEIEAVARQYGIEIVDASRVPLAVRRLVGALAAENTDLIRESADKDGILAAETERANAAERRAAEAEARAKHAYIDDDTRLPNKRAFLRDMRLLYSKLERRNGQMQRASDVVGAHDSLLFLDLDNFKPVNERLGYDFGNTVLKVITQELRDSQRPGDETYRWGGDEFTKIARNVAPGGDEGAGQSVEDAVLRGRETLLAMINDPTAFRVLLLQCKDEVKDLDSLEAAAQLMREIVSKLGVSVGVTPIDAALSQQELVRKTSNAMQILKHAKKQQSAPDD